MTKKAELLSMFRAQTGKTTHSERIINRDLAKLTGYWPSRITDYQTFEGRR